MDKVDDVSFMKRCFRQLSVRHVIRIRGAIVFMLSCPDWVLTVQSAQVWCVRCGRKWYVGRASVSICILDSSVGDVIHVEIRVSFCLRHSFHSRHSDRFFFSYCADAMVSCSCNETFFFIVSIRCSFTAPLNGSCGLRLLVVSGRERGQSVIKSSCVRTDAVDCFWVVVRSF
jgi:hypothetical protein